MCDTQIASNKLPLLIVPRQIGHRYRLPSSPNVIPADFAPQSHNHVARRCDALLVFRCSKNNSTMYPSPVRTGFTPSETPHIWPTLALFN
jgi:hypothetical protein